MNRKKNVFNRAYENNYIFDPVNKCGFFYFTDNVNFKVDF